MPESTAEAEVLLDYTAGKMLANPGLQRGNRCRDRRLLSCGNGTFGRVRQKTQYRHLVIYHVHFVGGFAFFDAFACSDKCAPWNTRALLVQLIACRGKRLQSLGEARPADLVSNNFDLAKKAGFIPKNKTVRQRPGALQRARWA